MICWHHPKVAKSSFVIPLMGDPEEGCVKGKSSQGVEFNAAHLVAHFSQNEAHQLV